MLNALCAYSQNNTCPTWTWLKQAGGTGADRTNGVATDAAGNMYIAGSFKGQATFGSTTLTSRNNSVDILVAKYDPNGNVLWARSAGGTAGDSAMSVITDAAGNIYVTGLFSGTAAFGNMSLVSKGSQDVFVSKYDAAGNVLWVKQAGGAATDKEPRINTDATGNIYLSGLYSGSITIGSTALTNDGKANMFIAKYSPTGTLIWAKNAVGTGGITNNITVDAAGNVFATGSFKGTIKFGTSTFTSSNDSDVFLVKYNTSGNVVWAKQANTPEEETEDSSIGDEGQIITTDFSGNIYLAGFFEGYDHYIDNGNMFLSKYDASGNLVWTKTFFDWGVWELSVEGFFIDAKGNITLVGEGLFDTVVENLEIFIYKLDGAGNTIWKKNERAVVDGGYTDYGVNIKLNHVYTDPAGNLYISGYFDDYVYLGDFRLEGKPNNNPGWYSEKSANFFAIYDPLGNVAWAQLAISDTIATDPAGNVYLAGSFNGATTFPDKTLISTGSTDMFLARLTYPVNQPLNPHNHLSYGELGQDTFSEVIKTGDGGYLLGGSSTSDSGYGKSQNSQGGNDFWVVKVNSSGTKL